MIQKQTIHFFQRSEKHNTACGRVNIFSTRQEERVTCKKCLGAIRIAQNKIPKMHLGVTKSINNYYDVACHSVGGFGTPHTDLVNCKKCIHIITKSLRACQ